MTKLLITLKVALLIALFSSIFWSQNLELGDTCRLLVVLACGALIPFVWSSSVAAPSFNFTLQGSASRIPKGLAFSILPFLILIPLGFQPELMEYFKSWLGLLRSFQTFGSLFSESGLALVRSSIPLLGGGLYLLFVFVSYQVVSKIVVDFFFESQSQPPA